MFSLSGGSQQKVLLARWLAAGVEILVLEEPTRGVDVGTKAEIYGLLDDLASRGSAVLVITSDIEEAALARPVGPRDAPGRAGRPDRASDRRGSRRRRAGSMNRPMAQIDRFPDRQEDRRP